MTQQIQHFYQSKNGITLIDGFYWVAQRQKKYITVALIQNIQDTVLILNTPARMSIKHFLDLEIIGGSEILERIEYPKKVLKYKFDKS